MEGLKHAVTVDLADTTVRALNAKLHDAAALGGARAVSVLSPAGRHNLAVGLDADLDVEIRGHAGYFIGGMNKRARVTVHGNVGWSVAENMMSGLVRVRGSASECAGASARGGLLVVHGDASSRCGISLKGADIVVGGSVGHVSAFMAQAGRLLVCGDAGPGLGDSLYEAVIYVGGRIEGLGADAREEPLTDADRAVIAALLDKAQIEAPGRAWKRVASARTLYNWNSDNPHEI